ncbi:MAG: hypothetical protein WAN60_20020 [Candidatus Sulfotelmatobacter sp.]
MSRISPTLEGFRAAFRRPSITLAEISWRWAVGATAAALVAFSLLEYLDTLPVSGVDILLLRTRQPILIGQALGHIFHGSVPRIEMAALVAAIALICLWIFAVSVGRATTVRSLIDYFAERQKLSNDGERPVPVTNLAAAPHKGSQLGSVLRLNFVRAAVALAALLGLVGAVIVVHLVSDAFSSSTAAAGVTSANSAPPAAPAAVIAFLLFFPLAGLIFLAWSSLNWVLSLAGVFAVRDGDARGDALGALSAAVSFCRERSGAVFAVSFWTGLAHLTVFVVAATVVSMPLSLAQIVPARVVAVAVVLITVAYFAAADWLYMARLGGYVCIAEMPEALLAPIAPAPVPAPPASRTTMDRDEPILSDVPNLAVET